MKKFTFKSISIYCFISIYICTLTPFTDWLLFWREMDQSIFKTVRNLMVCVYGNVINSYFQLYFFHICSVDFIALCFMFLLGAIYAAMINKHNENLIRAWVVWTHAVIGWKINVKSVLKYLYIVMKRINIPLFIS